MIRPWLRHYDYWVPPSLTYPQRPLCEILDIAAIDVADRPATAFLGAELTFREIKTQSDAFAHALVELGVTKGDRVGIMLPNCPQYIVVAFAVLRLGAVVVNVNPTYTAREILSLATDSGMTAMIALDVLAPLVLEIRPKTRIAQIVVTSLAEYSAARSAPPRIAGTLNLADLIAGARQTAAGSVAPRIAIAPDDLAVLQYTGGTTGTPKGAMLTHRNIFANVVQSETVHYRSYIRGEARYLIVIPYFHIYAFTVGMMQGIWVGGLQILIPKYDVEDVPTHVFSCGADHIRVVALTSAGARVRTRPGAPFQLRRRAVPRGRHRGVRAADRPDVERRLRPLRDLSGHALDAAACGAQAWDRRPSASRHRHQSGRRRERQARAAVRRGRRAMHRGPSGDERLLEPSRRNRAGAPCGRGWPRLVSYRRHRAHRRGRLHVDRPAQEGFDHRRRVQRVPIGS